MAKKLWAFHPLTGELIKSEIIWEYEVSKLRPTKKKWIDKKAKIWEWDHEPTPMVLLAGCAGVLKKDTFKTKKDAIASKKPLALVELW
jgi:hypothetical protein